ncbi:MAG: hypothetical protein JNL70_23505 [Saprospiraceae bacterium]|nr:hypothetical protein [Saprospiraceae bacterium]
MKRRNIAPVKIQTTEELEKAVKSLHRSDSHAYNFKIPIELYDDIQNHLERSGQTLKSFLIFSIKDYLKNNRLG